MSATILSFPKPVRAKYHGVSRPKWIVEISAEKDDVILSRRIFCYSERESVAVVIAKQVVGAMLPDHALSVVRAFPHPESVRS